MSLLAGIRYVTCTRTQTLLRSIVVPSITISRTQRPCRYAAVGKETRTAAAPVTRASAVASSVALWAEGADLAPTLPVPAPGRMDWMTGGGGFNLFARAPPPLSASEAAAAAAASAKAARLQAEIAGGVRDSPPGLFGLNDPKKDPERGFTGTREGGGALLRPGGPAVGWAAGLAPAQGLVEAPEPAWKKRVLARLPGVLTIPPPPSMPAPGAAHPLPSPAPTPLAPFPPSPPVARPHGAPPPAAAPVDLNKLHASLIRARMLGDSAKVAALQAQIDAAPPAPAPAASGSKRPRETEGGSAGTDRLVIVSAYDARGMPVASLAAGPGGAALAREDLRTGRRVGKITAPVNAVGADGKRVELAFGDTAAAGLSIAQLARAEKLVGSGDLDASVVRNMVRGGGRLGSALASAGTGRDEEDEGALDDAGRLVAPADARLTAAARLVKDMSAAIAGAKRTDAALARCPLCLDSAEAAAHAHRVLVTGPHCYVCLPPEGPATPGHVLLVVREHVGAMTGAAEEAYEEANRFKGALSAMYRAGGGGAAGEGEEEGGELPLHIPGQARRPALLAGDGEDADFVGGGVGAAAAGCGMPGGACEPVFVETALHVGSRGGEVSGAAGLMAAAGRVRHARIDVFPLPLALASDAPIFFRKAILDSEEWTTNRALIDTSGKGLRRAIPPGFSYFHASWRGGGFVHPIEEEATFPRSLGSDVVRGLRGEGPARGGRRAGGREGRARAEEEAEAAEFLRRWAPFAFEGTV